MLTDVILYAIRVAGFNVGVMQVTDTADTPKWHLSAMRPDASESWVVMADDRQTAAIELAKRVGIPLEV